MRDFKLAMPIIFVLNFLVYGLNSIYSSFTPLILEANIESEITRGYILAIAPISMIFATFFWGIAADKAKVKNNILALSIGLSAISYLCVKFFQSSVAAVAAVLFITLFFMSSFNALIDTITLEYTSAFKKKYGIVRVGGTIGYGAVAFLLGFIIGDNLDRIFFAYLIFSLINIILLKLAPQVRGHSHGVKRISLKPIFADKSFMKMVFIYFVQLVVHTIYTNFYSSYFVNTLGHGENMWGILVFVTILGEIPFFFMYDKLFGKFSIKQMQIMGIVITVTKYVLFSFVESAPIIIIIATFTGFAPIITTYCATQHITHHIPDELKASGQSVLYTAGNGLGRVFAGVAGGYLVELFGMAITFIICSCVVLITVFLVLSDKEPKKNT